MNKYLRKYGGGNEGKNGKQKLHIKNSRLVFLICVLIAAFFWLLINLSNVYTIDNSFTVSYKNEPDNFRVTKLIDSTLSVRITARGFLILKLDLFNDMDKLQINLNNYTLEKHSNSKYSIYTQELTKKLSELMGIKENNINFSKAKITFVMEKTGEKVVKIIPVYDLVFASQYDLYNSCVCEPSSIKVYGPQSILDTLQSVYTYSYFEEDVSADVKAQIGLQNPLPGVIKLGTKNVNLFFKVEKFTESNILVPINTNGLKYNVKTFPSKVQVYFRVAQNDFNKVRSHQFNISPIINDLDLLEVNKLPLSITKHPDFVRNIRIVPPSVEFLIIK